MEIFFFYAHEDYFGNKHFPFIDTNSAALRFFFCFCFSWIVGLSLQRYQACLSHHCSCSSSNDDIKHGVSSNGTNSPSLAPPSGLAVEHSWAALFQSLFCSFCQINGTFFSTSSFGCVHLFTAFFQISFFTLSGRFLVQCFTGKYVAHSVALIY